jgi:hypothetical protein
MHSTCVEREVHRGTNWALSLSRGTPAVEVGISLFPHHRTT